MPLLTPHPLYAPSADLLHCEENHLHAEASTLGFRPGVRPAIQLYSESRDEGIFVRSQERLVPFLLHRTDRGEGDEVICWHYIPLEPPLRERGVHLTVYND